MLLRKTLSLSDVSLKMEGEAGRFSGYASKFGNVDADGDVIVQGAFDYTLRTNGKPKMFLEHSPFSFGASGAAALPLGKYITMREDDIGLYCEGELTPGMSLSSDVLAAMKHGTLDGLSVGGLVKKGDYDETETGRVIRRWTKLLEVSVVAFPANGGARIESVKGGAGADVLAAIEELDSIRELERLLRDAAGFSKGAATALVARAKQLFDQGEPGEAEAKAMKDVMDRIGRITA